MKNFERDIGHYNLSFSSSSKVASCNYKIEQIFNALKNAKSDGFNSKPIKKDGDNLHLELKDFSFIEKDNYAVGYVVITTKSTPAPFFRNVKDGTVRIIDRTVEEVDEYGGHFFIDKRPDKDHNYCMYIEKVAGLGASNIERLLRFIVEQYHKDAQNATKLGFLVGDDLTGKKDKNGKPRKVGYRLLAQITGIPSDDAKDIINNGLATGLVLTKPESKTPFAGRSYMIPKEEELKIKFRKDSFVQNLWDDIKNVLISNSKKYDKARISFKDNSGNGGQIYIDTATGNFLSERFTKVTTIKKISPVLRNSSKGIVPHFRDSVLLELPK